MSYIRTKDGRIIDTTKYPEHPASWSVQASDYALTIKQSENLEELCDEFVVIDKETKEVMNIVAFWEYAKLWVSWKYNIYGAVWCEFGLKYIAKLNLKGELELI